MKKLLLAVVFVLLALPAVSALGDTSPQSAEQQCRAQQSDSNFAAKHGGKTFEQFYGTNRNQENAFGMCVSSNEPAASTSSTSMQPSSNANEGQAEANELHPSLNANEEAVEQHSTATANDEASEKAAANAAKACRAERSTDAAAFKAKHGTNHNKSNAFGKCVSAKAKA